MEEYTYEVVGLGTATVPAYATDEEEYIAIHGDE